MTVLLILQRWNGIGEPMDDGVAQLARQLMESGLASLGAHERHVIALVAKRLHAAQDVNCLVETRQTAGERLADKVAKLGGSWAFILMSQNRQAARDRVAAALDYEINLKAEVEIMALHDKLDRIRLDHLEAMIQGLSQQIADAGKPG